MNQNPKNRITYGFKIAVIGIALGLGLQFVRAWTEPAVAPPGGNVGAPINTGANTQWKGVLGDITKMGSMGIWGSLETYGFKMLTGAGAGKVLTSDATGVGSWQTGGGGTPAGVISAFGGTNAPAGYLLCDGANNISRTTYPALFAVIGTTYGSGSGGDTFKLPDLRQKFPIGKAASGTGATLGGTGGTVDASISAPAHTHTLQNVPPNWGDPYIALPSVPNEISGAIVIQTILWGGGFPVASPITSSAGGGSSIIYNPPFQTVNYIIKY